MTLVWISVERLARTITLPLMMVGCGGLISICIVVERSHQWKTKRLFVARSFVRLCSMLG
jgi:hypothetical protein